MIVIESYIGNFTLLYYYCLMNCLFILTCLIGSLNCGKVCLLEIYTCPWIKHFNSFTYSKNTDHRTLSLWTLKIHDYHFDRLVLYSHDRSWKQKKKRKGEIVRKTMFLHDLSQDFVGGPEGKGPHVRDILGVFTPTRQLSNYTTRELLYYNIPISF